MFYLYLKIHNTTNKKYLGQTIKNPFTYRGSGTHWTNHIKKHGYDVTTIILYETPFSEELEEAGIYYSELWNIVESDDFANLIVEAGNTVAGKSNPMFGKTHTDETKHKISKSKKNKKLSDETKYKMSKSHTGKKLSESHIERMKINHTGFTNKNHSLETKYKMSVASKGRPKSKEHSRKISESLKNKKQTNTACPHCDKTGGISNMKRWHFDNCKNQISSS